VITLTKLASGAYEYWPVQWKHGFYVERIGDFQRGPNWRVTDEADGATAEVYLLLEAREWIVDRMRYQCRSTLSAGASSKRKRHE
jgi:hypothetical protein